MSIVEHGHGHGQILEKSKKKNTSMAPPFVSKMIVIIVIILMIVIIAILTIPHTSDGSVTVNHLRRQLSRTDQLLTDIVLQCSPPHPHPPPMNNIISH